MKEEVSLQLLKWSKSMTRHLLENLFKICYFPLNISMKPESSQAYLKQLPVLCSSVDNVLS